MSDETEKTRVLEAAAIIFHKQSEEYKRQRDWLLFAVATLVVLLGYCVVTR